MFCATRIPTCTAHNTITQKRRTTQRQQLRATVRDAGPTTPPPDYTDIDAKPFNKAIMKLFQDKVALAVGENTDLLGYARPVRLCRKLAFRTARVLTRPVVKVRCNLGAHQKDAPEEHRCGGTPWEDVVRPSVHVSCVAASSLQGAHPRNADPCTPAAALQLP
jgi:hypothetical protein